MALVSYSPGITEYELNVKVIFIFVLLLLTILVVPELQIKSEIVIHSKKVLYDLERSIIEF